MSGVITACITLMKKKSNKMTTDNSNKNNNIIDNEIADHISIHKSSINALLDLCLFRVSLVRTTKIAKHTHTHRQIRNRIANSTLFIRNLSFMFISGILLLIRGYIPYSIISYIQMNVSSINKSKKNSNTLMK